MKSRFAPCVGAWKTTYEPMYNLRESGPRSSVSAAHSCSLSVVGITRFANRSSWRTSLAPSPRRYATRHGAADREAVEVERHAVQRLQEGNREDKHASWREHRYEVGGGAVGLPHVLKDLVAEDDMEGTDELRKLESELRCVTPEVALLRAATAGVAGIVRKDPRLLAGRVASEV
eukprot:scaffold13553_cov80-Phaeocystis_antarctica.AAC.5